MHSGERPRSVGPARAAAMLYGDWGTSKAYVLGIAFGLAGYSSFPILLAMAGLTALVGLNYYWVCSQYPDGGGVYSAVRERSRMIASVGALLLLADYLVTASLSVLEGFNYISHLLEGFGIHMPSPSLWAIGFLLFLGVVNWWGAHHSGSAAVALAIPASIAALSVGLLALPHLSSATFVPSGMSFGHQWQLFAGIVLALSGVEAVSNITGIMVADEKPGKDGRASVRRTSAIAIGVVALEVVGLTILLAWAMHAMPGLDQKNIEAMVGQLASYYGTLAFGAKAGAIYASVVGAIVALLLFSAGNTAINGMVSVYYMMSKDREMPERFGKLNRYGVPILPLILASALPCVLLLIFNKTESLAHLYAIGVVGAITINLGACATNTKLTFSKPVRFAMGATAVVMCLIWITIGIEKKEALIFAITILMLGLFARSFVQERRQTAEEREFDAMLSAGSKPESMVRKGEVRILVALRGVTPTMQFAFEEAKLRGGRVGVLFVREVQTMIPVEDPEADADAVKIFKAAQDASEDHGDAEVDLIYRVSSDVAGTIAEVIKKYRPDYLIMGAPTGKGLESLLRGSVVSKMAPKLPGHTRLIIYSWNTK